MTRSLFVRTLALSSVVLAAFVVASAHAQATTSLSATFGVAIPDVASQPQDSIAARKLLQAGPCTYCAGQPKQPVCGKNGKTYDNYCLATCIKQPVVYFGACNPKPCLCPPFFAPVCGGGKSYFSPCHAACAGVKGATAGLCPADCKCPSTKATVTGYDGKAYDNVCKAGCAGTEVAYSGTPDARIGSCKCAPDYNPVCEQTIKVYPSPYPGLPETKVPINITHLNPCIAACKGAKATKPGPCADYIKWDTKSYLCGCPLVYDPVCATIPILGTTITVASKCAADCSGFNKTVPGICPGCICPAEAKPVCVGKKTYKTACAARCEGGATTWTEGACTPCSKCPKPTGLPSDYVCTTSKQSLPSACLAECVGETVASKGMCTYIGR